MDILARLRDPFPEHTIKWKPGATSGEKAMVMAFIDARDVMDRLDEVLGPANWQSEFAALDGGIFKCRLSLRLGGEWIYREEVGGASKQPDAGDKAKAACSAALKRAAAAFGIGRYLYRLPRQWVAYDSAKKQLKDKPKLPPWALPPKAPTTAATTTKEPAPPWNGPDAPPYADLDPAEYITEEHLEYLVYLTLTRGFDLAKMRKRFGVNHSVGEFTVKSYAEAIAGLEKIPAKKTVTPQDLKTIVANELALMPSDGEAVAS